MLVAEHAARADLQTCFCMQVCTLDRSHFEDAGAAEFDVRGQNYLQVSSQQLEHSLGLPCEEVEVLMTALPMLCAALSLVTLQDRKKFHPRDPQFSLAAVDLVETPQPQFHVAPHLDSIRYRLARLGIASAMLCPIHMETPTLTLSLSFYTTKSLAISGMPECAAMQQAVLNAKPASNSP